MGQFASVFLKPVLLVCPLAGSRQCHQQDRCLTCPLTEKGRQGRALFFLMQVLASLCELTMEKAKWNQLVGFLQGSGSDSGLALGLSKCVFPYQESG